jgi:hypothetical protein
VYGFKPGAPIDLITLAPVDKNSREAEDKAESMKKIHQQVVENIEKKTLQYKTQADKGRKEVVFEPGDWVWLYMRHERFPNQRKSKLSPRGDGPFQVLEKINNNAYKLDLPSEWKISNTFNVVDLSPFDVGEAILRSESSQEGGNDEDIGSIQADQEEVPTMYVPPRTRAGTKRLMEGFDKVAQALVSKQEKLEEQGLQVIPRAAKEEQELASTEWPLIKINKAFNLFSINEQCESSSI